MSDEPVEDDDSGSDATGASSSSGSDEPDEEPSHGEDEWTWDEEPKPRESDDEADGAAAEETPGSPESLESSESSESPEAPDSAVGDSTPNPAGWDPTDTKALSSDDETDEDVASDDESEEHAAPGDETDEGSPSDAADDDVTPTSPTGRPGYTDDHVTAGPDPDDESSPDDASEPAGAGTNPGDHAPIGTQAPAPDEGPSSTAASATGAGAGGGGGGGGSSILSGGIGGTAPPDDEEMPLTEHIEEMLTRLAIVVVVASLATLAAFPFANDVIIQMWYDVHNGSVQACQPAPQTDGCVAPHVYGPLELVLTRIRVAGLVGLLVALPLAVYQIYRFMRPGLYPHERRYYLAAVPFSLVLGIVGMTFAYFVLLPLLFEYFITYTEGSADLAFQLAETMNLVLLMMGMLAIIFQIPLLIMLAIMMGITTRRWLERRRLYFWGLFLGVAVIFGPDPTGMAPFLLTATMVALFEGTLLLLRWTGR